MKKKSMLPFSENTSVLAKILDEDEFRYYLLPTLNSIYFDELSKEIGLTKSYDNNGYFMLNNGTYYNACANDVRKICSVEIELKKLGSSIFDSVLRVSAAYSHEYRLPAEEIKIHPIIKISLGYKES